MFIREFVKKIKKSLKENPNAWKGNFHDDDAFTCYTLFNREIQLWTANGILFYRIYNGWNPGVYFTIFEKIYLHPYISKIVRLRRKENKRSFNEEINSYVKSVLEKIKEL